MWKLDKTNKCTICLPEGTGEDKNPALITAAEELRRYLCAIIEGMNEQSIAVENRENSKNTAIFLRIDGTLANEEYRISIEGSAALGIASGTPRGVLYGVFAFLRALGWEFYAADCEKIPSLAEILLPDDFCLQSAPALEYRDLYWSCTFDPAVSVKLRVNGCVDEKHRFIPEEWGGGVSYAGPQFVHTFEKLLPPEEYFEKHPEYYSEIDGVRTAKHLYSQLCLTNEEVYRLVLVQVRQYLKDNPQAKIFSLSQNDSFVLTSYCTCAACRAVDAEEGTPMGSLLRFVNRIADAIAPEFPDVAIDTLAYQYSLNPPKLTAPRPNVIIRYCTGICAAHSLRTCEAAAGMRQDLIEWGKRCRRMYIWDYTTNFAHYLTPFPNIDCMADHVRFYVENGVKGLFAQGMYQDGLPGGFGELRCYILSCLMWDPTCEVRPLEEAFCQAYYGSAAGEMLSYLDEMHRLVATDGRHFNLVMAPSAIFKDLIDEEELAFIDGIWKRAEEKLTSEETLLARVRRSELSWRYYKMEAKRGDFANESVAQQATQQFYTDCHALGVIRISEGANVPPPVLQ